MVSIPFLHCVEGFGPLARACSAFGGGAQLPSLFEGSQWIQLYKLLQLATNGSKDSIHRPRTKPWFLSTTIVAAQDAPWGGFSSQGHFRRSSPRRRSQTTQTGGLGPDPNETTRGGECKTCETWIFQRRRSSKVSSMSSKAMNQQKFSSP